MSSHSGLGCLGTEIRTGVQARLVQHLAATLRNAVGDINTEERPPFFKWPITDMLGMQWTLCSFYIIMHVGHT